MKRAAAQYIARYDLDTTFNYLLLLGISLLFVVTGYIGSTGVPAEIGGWDTPLWRMVVESLPHKSVRCAARVLLLIGSAYLIHRAHKSQSVIRCRTALPFFFYIIFVCTNPQYLALNATSVGVFCTIAAVYLLFVSCDNPRAVGQMFNAAFLTGVGSLLCIHILWFIPFLWWAMRYFNIMSWRTFLASLMGVGVIYWLLWGWCVWRGDYSPFTVPFAALPDIALPNVAGWRFSLDWVRVLFVGLPALLAVINIHLRAHEDGQQARRFLRFLILFAVAGCGLALLYEPLCRELLGITCMPIAILTAHFFAVSRSKQCYWLYYGLIFVFTATLLIFGTLPALIGG